MNWSDLPKYAVALGIACAVLACGGDDDDGGQVVIPDTTPPAAVTDLAATSVNDSVRLTWTAPGDDGANGRAAQYDIRYAGADFDWQSATVLTPPVPRAAGQPETLDVTGLSDGDWSFALKAADEVPNWSDLSNVASTSLTIPPGAVTNLRVAGLGANSVTLAWTAPGGDGAVGQATEYDLRRAFVPITSQNWGSAVHVAGVPAPAPAGASESFAVEGLYSPSGHFFAVRSRDEAGNWSAISNVTSAALGLVQLTTNPAPGSSGANLGGWSPDGGRIVFRADWYGVTNSEIFTTPAGGGTSVRLTNNSSLDTAPAWSHDGERIAFVKGALHVGEYSQIWIMAPVPNAPASKLTNETMNVGLCDWSPDDASIVYDRYTISPSGSTSEVRIIPTGGGSAVRLVDGVDPRWSPDGGLIAYSSNSAGDYDIWVVPAAGGEPVRVTDSPAYEGGPAWSPDGTRLAFYSDRGGNMDIWTVAVGGGEATQVTTDPGLDIDPAWSPDGSRIVFSSRRTGTYEIWSQQLQP